MHTSSLRILTPVTVDRLEGVMRLFGQAWWTRSRSRAQVAAVLGASSTSVGVTKDGELVAFARAITDFQFKAIVVDVIVAESVRSEGLGRFVTQALLDLPALADVDDFELYCEPGLVPYYRQLGFEQPDSTCFMRRPCPQPR